MVPDAVEICVVIIQYILIRPIISQRRSIAKSIGCFQRRLFVRLFVNMITSERVNIG